MCSDRPHSSTSDRRGSGRWAGSGAGRGRCTNVPGLVASPMRLPVATACHAIRPTMPTFSRAFGRTRIDLHYSERGDHAGRPIVLTHGLLWSSRMMEGLASRLPDQRVLLLDLHGHGKSSRPTDPSAYTWASLAGDVIALLNHLEVDEAVVGGLSLGANVTLAVAHRHPERVTAMLV